MSENDTQVQEGGAPEAPSRKRRRGERKCPKCGSAAVRPSRPEGPLEKQLRTATSTRYHRCAECGWRGRLPRGHADAPKAGKNTLFWVAVVLLVGLVGMMLILAR